MERLASVTQSPKHSFHSTVWAFFIIIEVNFQKISVSIFKFQPVCYWRRVLDENACGASPCRNGANCVDTMGGYTCGPCPASYTGYNCDRGMYTVHLTDMFYSLLPLRKLADSSLEEGQYKTYCLLGSTYSLLETDLRLSTSSQGCMHEHRGLNVFTFLFMWY